MSQSHIGSDQVVPVCLKTLSMTTMAVMVPRVLGPDGKSKQQATPVFNPAIMPIQYPRYF